MFGARKKKKRRVPDRVGESAERLRKQSAAIAHETTELAATGAERAREVGSTVAERARQRMPELRERLSENQEVAAHAAQQIGHQLTEAAQVGAERMRDVGTRVSTDVAPTLRELATQAATVALDRWEAARARAAEAPERAAALARERAGLRPETPEEILERARHAAEDALQVARHSAEEILARARRAAAATAAASGTARRGESVAERAAAVQEQAKREARQASRKAAETGNETLGLLFWGGAAAGIVWYVLLDRERREQLERFGRSAWSQGFELWRDLKGYDEQF